jgi:hypothetical protein
MNSRKGRAVSKRAPQFERVENDYYPTPLAAIEPLIRVLPPETEFYEPCAGDGSLAHHLIGAGMYCMGMSDAHPQDPTVTQLNAHVLSRSTPGGVFITNPPWEIKQLHPLIRTLIALKPAWLLLYTDWLFTKQAAQLVEHATDIVTIGRVKWIPDSPNTSKDNACWIRFSVLQNPAGGPTLWPRV